MTPEEVELLSQLTIVIPTYNRPLALERSIEYWRDTPVTVHILDGSDEAFFADGLQAGTERIFYHSFPNDNETAMENWGRRLNFGTSLMKTKFSALCCDDDVFTLNGLIKALNLIDGGIVDAVDGKTGEYLVGEKQINWIHKYPHWQDEPFRLSESVRERLFFDNGGHAFYAIFKSETLASVHSISSSDDFPVNVWKSMLKTVTTRIFCRVKFIDDLFWLKCGVNYPEARPIKFAQLFWDEQFEEHKVKFLEIMAKALQVAEPMMTDTQRSDLVASYASQFTRPKRSKKVEIKVKAGLLKILGGFPESVRSVMFSALPESLRERIGSSEFQVNYKPVVQLLPKDLRDESLVKWEKVLLMPREELRLRANV